MGTWNTICDPGVLTQTLSYLGGGLDTGIISGNFSSIFGGQNNTVSGNCSAILGGNGNNDGGFDLVGIFGNSVNGVMSNAFHINELVIQNIPVITSPLGWPGLATGQIYTTIAPLTGWAQSPLYIK